MGPEQEQLSPEEVAQLVVGEQTDDAEVLVHKPVADLQLSIRSHKCLEKLNLNTIGELTSTTEAELLGSKNFGVTSLNEIKKALTDLGLSLRILD